MPRVLLEFLGRSALLLPLLLRWHSINKKLPEVTFATVWIDCPNSQEGRAKTVQKDTHDKSFEHLISLKLVTLFTLQWTEPINSHPTVSKFEYSFCRLVLGSLIHRLLQPPPPVSPTSLILPYWGQILHSICFTLFPKILSSMKVKMPYSSLVFRNASVYYLVLNKFGKTRWTKQILWHPGDWLRKEKTWILSLRSL